jgi:hypothetical protein
MDFTTLVAYFALAAFWVNTLLIVAAGWQAWAGLGRRYAAALAGARRGTVVAGAGPDGALALLRVRQVGRTDGRGPLLLHDRAAGTAVFGGEVALAGGEVASLAEGGDLEVWPSAATRRRAASPAGVDVAAARRQGARAAGWERTVELPLRVGDAIWLGGQVLAEFDPRAWRARATALTGVFVVGVLAAAAGCTALCLWPPAWGTVSKLGAFAALVLFNLFQLLGKLHHDAIQPPRALGGAWK